MGEWERERESIFDEFLRIFFPNQNPIEAKENIKLIDGCDVSNMEFSFLWGKMLFLHDDDDEKYLF